MSASATPDASSALETAEAAVRKLDLMCCEPGRSPRIREIGDGLESVKQQLDAPEVDREVVVGLLEETGARIGALQVGCCAPPRMPVYARLLDALTEIQLAVNAAAGSGHSH